MLSYKWFCKYAPSLQQQADDYELGNAGRMAALSYVRRLTGQMDMIILRNEIPPANYSRMWE